MSGGASTATVVAVIGATAAAAGAATTAAASIQQANAAQAASKYQSQVADSNAQIANQNADFAAASGEQQAAIQEQKTRAQVGAIAASQASSGVDVGSLTDTNVRKSQDELGQLDAQTIRSNAARQAYGYETQSTNFGNQSAADLSQGANAETAGDISAGGGLLSSAGNTSLNYSKTMNGASGLGSTTFSDRSTEAQAEAASGQ